MIKVEINQQTDQKSGKLNQKKTETLANRIIDLLVNDKTDMTIEIFLISKEKIKKLNADFRQIAKETDVLTFPLNYIPSAKEKVLGTIFISPEVAGERNESLDELVTHGIIHLLGFDHEKKPQAWDKAIKIIRKDKNDFQEI